MFLKEIIINGFKSFADRTKILLQPGVTCIVGPNGCGKSNIVDAIRWVLGEQSAKALRGGKMQDVIFEGTDSRKPLSLCEVSLVFTDCEDQLGTAFHEVSITRRASREGGSDYFLNGKSCRLKDIQRLFMDTGIGRVSYSFMVQGQIDQILSSNPAERRLIFEEAAGITKYKSQRHEALLKLAGVEQNLNRVNDVVAEIDRQIGSLYRQAVKAVQYQKLKHRLTHIELAHYGHQYATRKDSLEGLRAKSEELSVALAKKQEALTELESLLGTQRHERSVLNEALKEAQETVFTFKSRREEAEHRRQMAQTRGQDLQQRIESLLKEIEALQSESAALSEKAEAEAQNQQLQLNLVGSVDQSLQEKANAYEALNAALQLAEKELQESRTKKQQHELQRESLKEALKNHEIALQTALVGKADGEGALQQLKIEVDAAKTLLESFATLEIEATHKKEAQAQKKTEREAAVQSAKAQFRAHQEELQKTDRNLAQKRAELQVLEGLQAKFEGCSEAARAVLQGKLGDSWPKEDFALLAPNLDIEEAYAPALELLLGAAADALVPSKAIDIAAFAEVLSSKKLGRVCISLPSKKATDQKTTTLSCLTPFTSLVKATQPGWEVLLETVLSGTYLTEDLSSFLTEWEKSPDFSFRYVVTPNGELIDSRGLVYTGQARSGQGMIERRTQIKKLGEKITEALAEQSAVQAKSAEYNTALTEAEEALQQAVEALNGAQQEISRIAAEKRVAQNECARLENLFAQSHAGQNRLTQKAELAKTQLEESQEKLTKLESNYTETHIETQEVALFNLRKDRDVAYEALSAARLELSEKRQQLETLKTGSLRLTQEKAAILSRLGSKEAEVQTSKAQAAALLEQSETAKEEALAIAETLSRAQISLEEKTDALQKLEATLQEQETALSQAHHALREEEGAHLSCAKKLAEESAAFDSLIEKVQADYNLELADVNLAECLAKASEPLELKQEVLSLLENAEENFEQVEFTPIDPENIPWPAILREIRSLKASIGQLGAVNVVAIDEYASLKERADFLKAQSADLSQARDEVLAAINEINHTSRSLFEETFRKVQVNFKSTFEKLFGGGVAELSLVESEDPLESGIEIVACPPGTKLKSLSLLSGGQKTMTAVALLFAIYQVKPSPFCVLDELDAPLDDANIGRFTAMLKEFTAFSQFLVITHSKRTITAADVLYGVTMPERGVTQLVSLKLEESHAHRQVQAEELANA